MEDKTVLLYSGGMDSWLIEKIMKPDICLFVRIHTKNNDLEYKKLLELQNKGLARKDIIILDYDLSMFERVDQNYYLPLRNLHLVTLAAHFGNKIILGSESSSLHYDNNEVFRTKAQDLISYLYSEKEETKVEVLLPFMNTSKTELLKMYLDRGGDIEEAYNHTYSCYNPCGDHECMNCSSCALKFVAFYNNNYKFKRETIDKFIHYVESNNYDVHPQVITVYNKIKLGVL